MKTLLITLGLAGIVFGHPALAAKDAYQEALIRHVHEAKRAQAAEEAKPRECAEAQPISAEAK